MGIRQFMSFLRQRSSREHRLLSNVPQNAFSGASVAIDANNYFYKFLHTETECSEQLQEHFCLLTSQLHDEQALATITKQLTLCETGSERHLLRSLYTFCLFCHTSLRIRQMFFVIDGAAPNVKAGELMERKQHKIATQAKLLNDRRALLVHRIYVLRWYQFLCLALAFLQAVPAHSDENCHSSKAHGEITHSPCVDALYRLLQNLFEWSLGTEMPEALFASAARNTFLAKLNIWQAQFLISVFARLRASVQTSFLVELDWLNDGCDDCGGVLTLKAVVSALIDAMILSAEQLADKRAACDHSDYVVRPFLVCVHVNSRQANRILDTFQNRADSIEACWSQCNAAFLVCCIVHDSHHSSNQASTSASAPSSDVQKPYFLFPACVRESCTQTFSKWEKLAGAFWRNREIFAHRHHHIWRTIDYSEWLCSSASKQWLQSAATEPSQDSSKRAIGGHGAGERTKMRQLDCYSERQKLLLFYCCCVPAALRDVYDTHNDDSHSNLLWTADVQKLFASASANMSSDDGIGQFPPLAACRDNAKEANVLVRFAMQFFHVKRHTRSSKRSACYEHAEQQQKRRKTHNDTHLCDFSSVGLLNDIEHAAQHTTVRSFGTPQHNSKMASSLERKDRQRLRYRITDSFLQTVVKFLRGVCGAKVLVAEHEAEATCAKLCRDQFAGYVFSDDIDALTFGAPNIVVDWPNIGDIGKSLSLLGGTVQPSFTPKIVRTDTLMSHFCVARRQFVLWCVLCGSDFVQSSLRCDGTTITNLLRIVKSCDSIADCVSLLRHETQKGPFEHSRQRTRRHKQYRSQQSEADTDDVCRSIEAAVQFFERNASERQTAFLSRQLQPDSVDETVHLHAICLSRKLASG